jgi:hypothetical protein
MNMLQLREINSISENAHVIHARFGGLKRGFIVDWTRSRKTTVSI